MTESGGKDPLSYNPAPNFQDPHLLDRKAVLEVYAAIINRTISDEMHQALVHEIFEHVDAQGRLLAKAGNALRGLEPRPDELLAEIRRAMK